MSTDGNTSKHAEKRNDADSSRYVTSQASDNIFSRSLPESATIGPDLLKLLDDVAALDWTSCSASNADPSTAAPCNGKTLPRCTKLGTTKTTSRRILLITVKSDSKYAQLCKEGGKPGPWGSRAADDGSVQVFPCASTGGFTQVVACGGGRNSACPQLRTDTDASKRKVLWSSDNMLICKKFGIGTVSLNCGILKTNDLNSE